MAMLGSGDTPARAAGDADGAESSISNDPAGLETESIDQASADPGVPSESLRIVSREPRRMGRSLMPENGLSCTECRYRCLIGFLLFLITVLVAVLCSRHYQQAPEELVALAVHDRAGPTLHVCERPGCLMQAAQTVQYLNRSADPCRDFYAYACGGFSEAHPTGTLRALGIRDLLERNNKAHLLKLLRQEQYYNTSTAGAISKARIFFSTCMQSYESGANNVLSLSNMLKHFGGLDLFGTWALKSRQSRATFMYQKISEFNFNEVLLNTTSMHPEQAFFTVRWDRELNLLALGLPKLAVANIRERTELGSREYDYLMDRVRQAMRQVLFHLERDSFGRDHPRECNNTCVEEMVEDVIAVQVALVAIQPGSGGSFRPEGVDARLTLQELGRLVPQIDWRRLLNALYGSNVVPDSAAVQVPSTDYMAGVDRIIDDTRYKRLYHFLVWHVIRRYLVALGPVYATLGEQLDHDFGSQDLQTREDQCLTLLEEYMAPALRMLLLSAHIGEHNLALVSALVKKAHGPLVDSFAWMTEDAQRGSRTLLDSMNVDFNDWNSVPGPLDNYYARLRFAPHDMSFFSNLNALYKFTPAVKIIQELSYGKTSPEDVRISYDIPRNTLMIPYGALQVPWYHADIPEHLNAAMLGSLIFEELSMSLFLVHVSSENLTSVWDRQTSWRLKEFTACLKDAVTRRPAHLEYYLVHKYITTVTQSHSIKPYSVQLDPDVVTIFLLQGYFTYHLSHRLYRQLERQDPSTVLPGMHHNRSSQAFYLAYAQTRCNNGYPVTENFGTGDIRQPQASYIINELMLGDPSFREAFECGAAPADSDSDDQRAGTCSLFKWPIDEVSEPSPSATGTM